MTGGSEPAAGPKLPPAYRLVALDRIDSTNAEAARRAEAGAEDGTLVWAREQSSGRGRQGRTWDSPPGNLYLSLVLRPECPPADAAQLGFVAALAVGDTIGTVGPPMLEVTYKWPNDVLLNGRKVSGILLESKTTPDGAMTWLVLGVGINVVSFPEGTETPATCIRFEGAAPDLNEVAVLEAFTRHMLSCVNRWLEDGFAPVRQSWLNHAHALGEEISVRLSNQTLTGTFRDLDERGALILDLADGRQRTIAAGDVLLAD